MKHKIIKLFFILSLLFSQGSLAIDSITALYRASNSGISIFIPRAELGKKPNLKDILQKHAFLPGYNSGMCVIQKPLGKQPPRRLSPERKSKILREEMK